MVSELEEPLREVKVSGGEQVVTVSAPGGCGKTTLAKMVCHDEEIRGEETKVFDSAVAQVERSRGCFSLDEIKMATHNFDDALVIGVGGFGKVYQGFINNGATVVAIKRLNVESQQGAREFWTEINMLSELRHIHLVELIGYCKECEEMILVYEYISHGTLADHIYKRHTTKTNTSTSLTWEQRLNICIGAARGLEHLHAGTNKSFIHRDVKTTNILLDKNLVAKISDFGLSKGPTSHSITHISTAVKGTFGYFDPDYFYTQRLTTKSDVYAFGVVLLEVLCGRPAVDTKPGEEPINLVQWAEPLIKKRELDELVDPSLDGQIGQRCLDSFVALANNCVHESPKLRPTMAEVARQLDHALSLQRERTEGIAAVFQRFIHDHEWGYQLFYVCTLACTLGIAYGGLMSIAFGVLVGTFIYCDQTLPVERERTESSKLLYAYVLACALGSRMMLAFCVFGVTTFYCCHALSPRRERTEGIRTKEFPESSKLLYHVLYTFMLAYALGGIMMLAFSVMIFWNGLIYFV